MTLEELLKCDRENAHVEFKEAKDSFSVWGGPEPAGRKSVYGYCVAIGNEGGGALVLGVADVIPAGRTERTVVGTNALMDLNKVEKDLFDKLQLKITIEEHERDDKRILVIRIPSRNVAQLLKFNGVPLMRVGDSLVDMTDDEIRRVYAEGSADFSSMTKNATLDCLDRSAIMAGRHLWAKRLRESGNEIAAHEVENADDETFLRKLGVVRDSGVTNAALLLFGSEKSLSELLPMAEIILEYRHDSRQMSFDYRRIWRSGFVKIVSEIEAEILVRNIRTAFRDGFVERDIWAFDLWSMREVIVNAFAHREYHNRPEPIIIKMSLETVQVSSPGGFPFGVNAENILDAEGKWRNRLLMEALQKIGLAERGGLGLDRVFHETISQGKGTPVFVGSGIDKVVIDIPAVVKDVAFVSYLNRVSKEKGEIIHGARDLIALEEIRTAGKTTNVAAAKNFLESGIIEKNGRCRYVLCREFYAGIGRKEEYVRHRWLNSDEQKQIILKYLRQNQYGKMENFRELFKERKVPNNRLNKLLGQLASEGVYFDGRPRSKSGVWRIRSTQSDTG